MKIKYIIMLSCILLCACNGSQKNNNEEYQDLQDFEEPSYTPQYPNTYNTESETTNNNAQEQNESAQKQNATSYKLSREYKEGYNAGYEDGEDDALNRNGYGGHFNNGCKYSGRQRKDYQLGYEEGYEAGFYDNVSDDGDDDEYE